jgi:tetratricopeptide (TPR) repeat protein
MESAERRAPRRLPARRWPGSLSGRWFFQLGIFLFLASAAFILAAGDDFAAANQLYEQGKFSDARSRYQNIALSGEWTPNLFYNLGNCEYRLGEPGRAMLDYERALALDPAHPEAKANLALLRNQTGAKAPAPAWEQYAFTGLSQDTWAVVAAAAGWIFVFGLAAAATSRRRGAGLWLATIAAAMVVAYGAGVLWLSAQGRGMAIVVVKSVEARLAPADSAGLADSLPAGSRVRVLSERGDWVYCELPGESRGWLPQSTIEKVRMGKS